METLPDILGHLPMISLGISGAVFALSESLAIKKKPLPGKSEKEQVDIERRIYERLGPHPYIRSNYFGARDGMIVLERLD